MPKTENIMIDNIFIDRINKLDKLIYEWMKNNEIANTTPGEVMDHLVESGIYNYDNKNGRPFRDDLRMLRDNDMLHLFRYIRVEQEHEHSPWEIYVSQKNPYEDFDVLLGLSSGQLLKNDIKRYETFLIKKGSDSVKEFLFENNIGKSVLQSSLRIKKTAGQINVIIHSIGIINTLPFILDSDELIESLSLGADNSCSRYDLITNKRIAEFKFINWKGSDTIRQNSTFTDFFNLAERDTDKLKYLYIFDIKTVMKFFNGGRAINSVLSKNRKCSDDFFEKYGNKYKTVSEYYDDNKMNVNIVDLEELCPGLFREKILEKE